ncbi:FAD binding domain-containing protein [Virgisporangium ochraceum]|uniref:FAD-binding domain-containing protein n=1 Tax=Virgisporangium ochraceum TaxID=65505 RepID=A0A8J4EGW0_9ACTN|nr:FAD-dependent monooxygenase [Virgisporangium ochraceum]GIJ74083.1 hypothetical protein Voc01_090000 [Virgisporangium ochraceum]
MGTEHHHPTGPRRLSVAVVGGSLTGPATALLLLQAGFEHVTVYEAVPDARPQTGGLLTVEHSTLDVLDRLGVDQSEFVHVRSERIVHTRIRDGRTETTHRVYPGRYTTWPLLHTALARRLPPAVVHSGHRVTDLRTNHGMPTLHFADGSVSRADVVVFADGRASTGRALLEPDRRMRYAGYVAHRGTAPTVAGLAHFERFEPCPGVQFNVAPLPDGADWTLYLDATPAEYTRLFGASPQRRPFVLPHHVGPEARDHVDVAAAGTLTAAQAAVVHTTTVRTAVAVADIEPPRQMVWPVGDGYAALLGDALAPVRPHTARGVNNGIEQAAGLVAALTQVAKYGADLGGALTGWQRRHLPAAVASVRLGPVIGGRLGLGVGANTRPAPEATVPAIAGSHR